MNNFMSGCEAIARGAWEGGVDMITSYPGSPVTDIVGAAQKFKEIRCQWAVNEKVAMEMAAGVAHGGGRVLTVMKHVGLNVAADPFFNLAYTGLEGGLVVVVGDDPGARSSQNEQDSRLLAIAANIPVLEPTNLQEAYLYTKLAFDISETFDVPVIVRVTAQHCYSSDRVVTGNRQKKNRRLSFAGPIQKYLLLPDFVVNRHQQLVNNLKQLANSDWNRWLVETTEHPCESGMPYPYGIICGGYIYNMICEVVGDLNIPIMKLGMVFPINEQAVREFANSCEKVLVLEESSRAIEQQVRQLDINTIGRSHFNGVGELQLNHLLCDDIPEWNQLVQNQHKKHHSPELFVPVHCIEMVDENLLTAQISVPKRPAGFCAGCSHSPIFHQLGLRKIYVVGDIGCYTLGATEPFSALHANLCMGASIGILQGYLSIMDADARKKAVAVIGDSTFFHSGIPPLLTAVNSKAAATILILDNSRSAMTGYQETYPAYNKDEWLKLLEGFRVPEYAVVDALDVAALSIQLDEFLASEKLSVMVVKGDCVQGLPRKGPTNYRYTIREDMCTSCGKCLETDCPSIVKSLVDDKATFAITNECIGCGFCSQTCPENAIIPLSVNFESPVLTKALAKVPWHRVIKYLKSKPMMKGILEKFEREYY
jgi:indolepyruvate ferredoxin oxidoreductase alpha subunit